MLGGFRRPEMDLASAEKRDGHPKFSSQVVRRKRRRLSFSSQSPTPQGSTARRLRSGAHTRRSLRPASLVCQPNYRTGRPPTRNSQETRRANATARARKLTAHGEEIRTRIARTPVIFSPIPSSIYPGENRSAPRVRPDSQRRRVQRCYGRRPSDQAQIHTRIKLAQRPAS